MTNPPNRDPPPLAEQFNPSIKRRRRRRELTGAG